LNVTESLVRSLPVQIADKLRMDLLCGLMVPGQALLESDLAERFGVSRTPIRSALVQLTQEGLLESQSHTGVQVAAHPPAEILNLIILIRCNVEVFALRSFFDEIDAADFKNWAQILNRLQDACEEQDYPAIAEQDLSLHRSILQRAGYRDLESLWMSIFVRLRHHFLETQRNYDDPMIVYHEHAKLVEVFRTGDIEASAKALAENIE
jgi:DNA-binding GntR family transcriptional regulator